MEKYRCSLLGRALADSLCDLIGDENEKLGMEETFGTEIFAIFDSVMSTYFERTETSSSNDDKTVTVHPFYTHEHMDLLGRAVSHNRYMENWSLEASLEKDSYAGMHAEIPFSMALDHLPQALSKKSTALVKLHG
uniref:AlNc14C167G7911 protein n=1 Tax=Albugo laibachii Nc14 TaxID=890382 RepID=F0WN79_9STRA|nr:AlNc14C167G7911 [Albugo laibachii Nc14]|eukprot:CCA22768.1 AlNc14C167G7911 [Albugo laibachii Nc14]